LHGEGVTGPHHSTKFNSFGFKNVGLNIWPKFEILTVLGAVFPHFCPDKREIWHGGADFRAKFDVYRGKGFGLEVCGAKNLFLDHWVKTIPAWLRYAQACR